jgi:hypothetical protein
VRLSVLKDTLPEGSGPLIVKREKDQYIYDIDGNKYIDFNLNEGSVLCGHNYKSISVYVKNALSSGSSSGYVNRLYYPLRKLFKSFVQFKYISFYESGRTALSAIFRDLGVKVIGVSSRYLAGLVSGMMPGLRVEFAEKGKNYDILLFEPIDFDGDLTDFNYNKYKAKWKCSVENRAAFRIKSSFMRNLEEVPIILCSGVIANGLDSAVIISHRHFEGELIPLYKTAAIMETVKIFLKREGFLSKAFNFDTEAISFKRGSIFKTSHPYPYLELLKSGIILKNGTGFLCMQHTEHDIMRLEKALETVR